MHNPYDQLLIETYLSIGETVDRIACFHSIRERFLGQLRPNLAEADDDKLIWRLFQLRKSRRLPALKGKG